MKKHYLLLLIAAIFLACNTNDPITPGGGGSSGGGGTTPGGGGTATTPTADFAYTPVPPLAVKFTNLSTGASSYKWDFGDGETSNAKEPDHQYTKTGMYDVTLTVTSSSGIKATKTKKILVSEPTVYIIGYKLLSIPYENRYYKLRVCDDYVWSPDWDWFTRYTPLLTFSDIPYTTEFQNVVEMDRLDEDSYYWIYLYHNTSTSNEKNDTQCMRQKLYVSEIKSSYADSYTLISDNEQTIVSILMGYE